MIMETIREIGKVGTETVAVGSKNVYLIQSNDIGIICEIEEVKIMSEILREQDIIEGARELADVLDTLI